jgi:hypothetical protein
MPNESQHNDRGKDNGNCGNVNKSKINENKINENFSSNSPQNITTKDLIYLYLREIDILQKHLDLLETRLSGDIARIETDYRDHNISNEKNFRELRENCKNIIDEINLVHICINKIKDNIHNLELQRTTCDLTQNNRLENLEVKVAIYSIIVTILSFIGLDSLPGIISFVEKLFS